MQNMFILLSNPATMMSRMIARITSANISHVSMAFTEDLCPLYSSGRKNGHTLFPAGPCREDLVTTHGYRRGEEVYCELYRLPVYDSTWLRGQQIVEQILWQQEQFHYNLLGVIGCRLGFAVPRPHHYFCSEFVATMLDRTYAAQLPKHPSLMMPEDFREIPGATLVYKGDLASLRQKLPPGEERQRETQQMEALG